MQADAAKPRIVYALPNYDPATGSHFFHICELLAAAAPELDIFLVIERASADPRVLGLPFYVQRFSLPPFRFAELFFVLLRERFRGRRYFYTHYSFYGGIASWLVARISGGRAYYWNCGMPWLYRRTFFKEAVFRFVLRRTVLVTGTDGIAREYAKRYRIRRERIIVFPNWITVSRFAGGGREEARNALGLASDAAVILFVHRLSRRKGAHLIPDIAAEVTKTFKSAIFVVAGNGPERKNLELKIKNLGLSNRVRIEGEVPHREIAGYFRAADVLIMPSEEEGFPHVLLEAMASGIPYAASDVGGVKDITPAVLRDCVIAPGDIKAFSLRILALLQKDPESRAVISDALKAHALKFDTAGAVPRFIKLFQQ